MTIDVGGDDGVAVTVITELVATALVDVPIPWRMAAEEKVCGMLVLVADGDLMMRLVRSHQVGVCGSRIM